MPASPKWGMPHYFFANLSVAGVGLEQPSFGQGLQSIGGFLTVAGLMFIPV